MEIVKRIIKRNRLLLIGLPVGALAGLLYWCYAGSAGGSGSLAVSPFYSALWGSMLGMITFGSFDDTTNREEEQ